MCQLLWGVCWALCASPQIVSLNPLHLSQRVGCKGRLTGHRTDAVYKARRSELHSVSSVCVCMCIFCVCVCVGCTGFLLCPSTDRSQLSSHSCFDAAAVRFPQRRTKEWQRETAKRESDTEIVDTVTDWDRKNCVSSSALHHFPISFTVPLYLPLSLQEGVKTSKETPSRGVKNCPKNVLSELTTGPVSWGSRVLLSLSSDWALSRVCLWKYFQGSVNAWEGRWDPLSSL